MHFSTLFLGACMVANVLASSYYQGVGYVRGGNSHFYFLDITGPGEIKLITGDQQRGWFVRPICWNIEAGYSCNFYEPSLRGHGPLVGQYEGFSEGYFGTEYAAYYECWRTGLERRHTVIEDLRTGIERLRTGIERRQRPNDRHRPGPLAGHPCGYLGVCLSFDNKYNMDYANLNSFNLVILTSDTYGLLNVTTTSAFLLFGHSDTM